MATRVVEYVKTEHGPVVVSDKNITLNDTPKNLIARYESFFQGVPLYGGYEWRTLSVDEIAAIFKQAAIEIEQISIDRRNVAIAEYNQRTRIGRWWQKNIEKWNAPPVYTSAEILQYMAMRSRNLSIWMKQNQDRPFYVGSNMSHFIWKPQEVADVLTKMGTSPKNDS